LTLHDNLRIMREDCDFRDKHTLNLHMLQRRYTPERQHLKPHAPQLKKSELHGV